MTRRPAALVVEDEAATAKALAEFVQAEGFDVAVTPSLAGARAELQGRRFDVVLSDLVLPDGSGLVLVEEIEDGSGTDVVFITGRATVETVVSALRHGALDYLTKPVDIERLQRILDDIRRSWQGRAARTAAIDDARRSGAFGRLVGRSEPMLRVYRQIQKVAGTDATVLLQGETGTGKEVVARAIHDLSTRKDEPFVPLNCGAVSSTLIESELFGHERGSFTGANRRHVGVFERSHQGTLFLDEITEMPLDLQVKLLRVLETRSFQRVGGESQITSEARLIAATNRAPEEAVRAGKLREDLFYRLRVFPIHLPPLHRRGDDVVLLAQRFLDGHNAAGGASKAFSEPALEWLLGHDWPGNVRELKNVVERAFILADDVIDISSLEVGDEGTNGSPSRSEIRIAIGSSIAEAERAVIMATLEKYRGNKQKAARILGISVKTLYNRLAIYEGA